MDSAYDDEDFAAEDTTPASAATDQAQGFRPGTGEHDITPEELAAWRKQQEVGAAPTGPAGPLPPGGTQATIRDGRFYDPSGREVGSIGETPEQAAERFGMQLPMTQRELQKLDQLRQSYGEVLRNPNLNPKAKQNMLLQMAREIHFGQARLQFQQRQQRMDQMQSRGAAAQEAAGHQMALHGLTTETMWSNRKEVPGGVFVVDPTGKPHFFKTEQPKPFSFSQARKETEDEIQATRPDLATPRSPDQFDDQIPESQRNVWKAKYGKDGADDDQRHEQAAAGWAKEAEVSRKRAYEEAVRQGVHEKRQAHGQATASAGAAPSGAGRSTVGAAPTPGQPAAPTQEAANQQRMQQQQAIQESHARDLAAIQKIQRPEEREAKGGALTRMNTIMAQWAGKTPPESVRAEVRRLKAIVTQQWPAAPTAPTAADRERNSDNANAFAGGT